jgi:CubicO group peptidase (beta-lactamase class C family)
VLAVEEPVARFLPEIPHADKITFAHLASHRSGIPSRFDSAQSEHTDPGGDTRKWITSGELAAPLGESFEYSRVGYSVLAWALERASGLSWRQAVTAMAAEAEVVPGFDEDNLATSHRNQNRHPGEGRYRGPLYAGGGLQGSIVDLARFYHHIFSSTPSAWLDRWFTHNPEVFTGFYTAGITVDCPCRPSGTGLVGSRGELAAALGFFLHDRVSGSTLVVNPEVHTGTEKDDPTLLPLFHNAEFKEALLAAAAPVLTPPRS